MGVAGFEQVARFARRGLAGRLAWSGGQSGKMWIDQQGPTRPVERLTHRGRAQVARDRGEAILMRVTCHYDSQGEARGVERFELLDPVRRNVRRVVQAGDAMLRARAVNFVRGEILLACDQAEASRANFFNSWSDCTVSLSPRYGRHPAGRVNAASVRRSTCA